MFRLPIFIRLQFFFVILCLISLCISACGSFVGSANPQKAPANKQTLVFTLDSSATIGSLDPPAPDDLQSLSVINMLFTGLVEFDDQLHVRPQLAQSYSVSPDGITYTFHLKPNLKFSDSSPLTSEDVAFSLDRALQPATKSMAAPRFLLLIKGATNLYNGMTKTIIGTGVTTPDKQTVVITTEKKASYFLNTLAEGCSFVVEKKMVQKYGTKFVDHLNEGGGAGPFKLESLNSKKIVLLPNANYYGPKPQINKLIIPIYPESSDGYKAYQAGQVDYLINFPIKLVPEARRYPKEYGQTPALQINYYAMNYLSKPFNNIHIRQAFALAIDKNAITHTIYHDLDTPTNHIVPFGIPGYNSTLKAIDGSTNTRGNVQMAQKLFAQGLHEDGYTSASQLPEMTLPFQNGDPDNTREIQTVVGLWKHVLGVTIKPKAEEYDAFNKEIEDTVDNPNGPKIWSTTWISDYPDPQNWLTAQFDQNQADSTNYGQNSDQTIADRQQNTQMLMEQADINQNPDARLVIYNQIEQKLVNDVAWMPMEQINLPTMTKPYVHGLITNPTEIVPPNDWAQVYISNH